MGTFSSTALSLFENGTKGCNTILRYKSNNEIAKDFIPFHYLFQEYVCELISIIGIQMLLIDYYDYIFLSTTCPLYHMVVNKLDTNKKQPKQQSKKN